MGNRIYFPRRATSKEEFDAKAELRAYEIWWDRRFISDQEDWLRATTELQTERLQRGDTSEIPTTVIRERFAKLHEELEPSRRNEDWQKAIEHVSECLDVA